MLLEELSLFAFLASSNKMASNPHKAYDSFQSLPSTISVDVSRSRVCSVHLILACFISIQQHLILKALLYQLQLQVGLNLLSLKFRKKN